MGNTSASHGGCERGVSTALPNITSELQSRTTKVVYSFRPVSSAAFSALKETHMQVC